MASSKANKEEFAVKQQTVTTPQQTLYVRNLKDKVNKDTLRRALYALFTKVGTVLDVSVPKRQATRGQAWVVFEDVETASKAKLALQGFNFMGQPLDIHFASQRSDVVSTALGEPTSRQSKRVAAQQEGAAKKARTG